MEADRRLSEVYVRPVLIWGQRAAQVYGDEQLMISDPACIDWSREDNFPADEVYWNRPASTVLWYEVDDLSVSSVGFTPWATPHPIFDVNEVEVVSLLAKRGYVCIRDDDLVWKAIWGVDHHARGWATPMA